MDAVCYYRKRTESTYAAAASFNTENPWAFESPLWNRFVCALTPIAPPVRLLSFRPQALLASDFELVSSHYSHDLTIFFAACCPILLL